MFDEGMSKDDAIRYGMSKKISKEQIDSLLENMTQDDKLKYQAIQKKLKDTSLSDSDRQEVMDQLEDIIKRYTND